MTGKADNVCRHFHMLELTQRTKEASSSISIT